MVAIDTASRRTSLALAAAAVVLWFVLSAATAGATTFCVPGFDPVRCPDNGENVAQADPEVAMQSDAGDGIPDIVIVAPGTYTDSDTFSPAGSDPLTVEGAGAGTAADPEATRLTSSASGNQFVLNLAAALSRPITVRDLTVVVPASFPDGQGAAMQVGGDTLERVDVEIANPGSHGMSSWPGGGTYSGGTVYAVGNGTVGHALRTGNSGLPGQVLVEDATFVEPAMGIWGQDAQVPVAVTRTTIDRPTGVGVFATEGGQITLGNSVVIVDGSVSALGVTANSTADPSLSADQLTIVQEETGAGVGLTSRTESTGKPTLLLENSIVRGFGSSYFRFSSGAADADLTIRHSNLEAVGIDIGPGTLDASQGNIDADPMFASVPPFGAPDELALLSGSPSIDAGDPQPGGLTADFLGAPRPADGDGDGVAIRDQGAFEAQPPPPPAPTPSPPAALPSAAPGDASATVRLLGRRLRVNRRGIARLRLHCPRPEQSPPCSGLLRVQMAIGRRAGTATTAKLRRVVLARSRFRIAAGRTKPVRLRVGDRGLRLLQRGRRARRVLAVASVRDTAGNMRVVRRSLRAYTR